MRNWDPKSLEKLLHAQEFDLKIRAVDMVIEELFQRSIRKDSTLNNLRAELVALEKSIDATVSQQEMYQNTTEEIQSAIKGLVSNKSGAFKSRTRSCMSGIDQSTAKMITAQTSCAANFILTLNPFLRWIFK